MQPLATTRLMMTWFSMYSDDESTTLRQNLLHTAYTLFVFILNVICTVASLAYCFKFFAIDLDGSIFALMLAIAEIGTIYFMFVATQMHLQIGNVFARLSTIYKSRKFNSVIVQCSIGKPF